MKRLIILSVVIASILYSKEDKVIVSINGLESAGLSKRYINYAQYTIQEISIDLEETVSKMIGDKYSINIHFTAYESVENTINVARDSLNKIIKTIKDKYPYEDLVTHSISHPYKGIQGVIIGKVQIQVNIDNSINLDKSIDISNKSSEIFDWIFMDLQDCRECISFNNMDIDSINRKNTILLTRDDIYDDSWAVIIGIDKYKYSDQLNYAVKDAEAVKGMLISKFDYPEENIRYLVNEQATLSEIKLKLGEIATSAGEDDRILVFYSGHGETLQGADGSEKGYIIPYEGRQDNPFGTGFAMDEILTTSQMSKSKHMLFLMDACYSGLMTEKAKGLSQPQEKGYLSKVANEKARQIITAGGSGEQVIERDEWQHSAFTKNLIAGLDDWEADTDDDGYITADELGTYLRKSVTEDSDFQQTPQKGRFRNSGGGEFVFFGSNNNTGQYDLDFDNKAVKSSISLKYWEYNPLGYNIAAPALGFKIKSRGKMTLFSSFIGASYSFNDRSAFDFGFQRSRNLSSHFAFTSNAIFIEYVEALALTDRIDPLGNYLYNTWGLNIENITYLDDKSNYKNEGIGVIPEVGLEWGWRWFEKRGNINWDGVFRISLGYAINDITNVEGEKFYRGLILDCGLALSY